MGEKLTWGSNNITSTTNNSYKSNNDKLYTAGKVDELLSSKITGVIVTGTSTSPATGTSTGVYSTERMNAILSSKVTVESGKGLSTNDYADADKTKVSKIGTIPTDWGTNDTIISVLGNKVDKTNDVIKGTDSTIVTTENSKVYSAKKTEDRIISVVTGNVVSETTTTTETTNVDKVYSVGRMNSILTTKVNTSDIIKTGTDNTDNKVNQRTFGDQDRQTIDNHTRGLCSHL